MNDLTDVIREHYQAAIPSQADLLEKIARVLDDMGGGPLTAARLAPLDQFHVGGLVATAELAKRVRVTPSTRILDAGSGLGGPSRYLAETFGCRVEGIDLAPDYVAVSELLTARAKLADRVHSRVGDLMRLPFENTSFDVVWTQHVVMNIRDRSSLYREMRRVLATDGELAFYDVLAADGKPTPHYPVPWAETAETSVLLTREETIAALAEAGFRVALWDDVTSQAVEWMSRPQPQPTPTGGASAAMVVGARMAGMGANFRRNLMEGHVRLVMGICNAARAANPAKEKELQ